MFWGKMLREGAGSRRGDEPQMWGGPVQLTGLGELGSALCTSRNLLVLLFNVL